MRKLYLLSFLVLYAMHAFCDDKDKILTVKQMHEDIDFYYTNLQQIHPNCFLVLNQTEFQKCIDSIKNSIYKPMSKKDFYIIVSYLNKYTDLHTRIAPSKKMLKERNFTYNLPRFICCESKYKNENEHQFLIDLQGEKYRLIKVNDIDIEIIIDYYLSRRNWVEINEYYNCWDMLNTYITEHFIYGDIVLTYINENKEKRTSILSPTKKDKKSKGYRVYNLEYDTITSKAIFELNTFMPKKLKQRIGFTNMIDKIFDTLKQKNINTLYIDLTCNSGGLIAFEEHLLKYLILDNKKITLWDLTLKQSPQRRKQRGNYPQIKDGDFYQKQQILMYNNLKNRFLGDVFVIQSRYSFSAASTLASQLQKYRKSKIIGEPCQIKAVYTDPILIKLKHSKLQFSCSTGFIKNVGIQKEKGVIPDIASKIYNPFDKIELKDIEKFENTKEDKSY